MPVLKAGTRLRSQVDGTEVIVVRAPGAEVDLRIGGHPAIATTAEPEPGLVAVAGEPALIGKRYTRVEGDLEILVTKAGAAGLAVAEVALHVKESKPLPSSD
jgi:hypothetical protein